MGEKKFAFEVFILLIVASLVVAVFVNYQKAEGFNTLPLRQAFDTLDLYTGWLTMLLAITIFVIAAIAYQKVKSPKMFIVMLAFALFALKWVLKILDWHFVTGNLLIDSIENIFELGVLALLFLALFKK